MSEWWVTTGVKNMNGSKVAGPFATRDQAWGERDRIEAVARRHDLWFEELPAPAHPVTRGEKDEG